MTIMSRLILVGIVTLILTPAALAQAGHNEEITITELQRQLDQMRSETAKMQNRLSELEAPRGSDAQVKDFRQLRLADCPNLDRLPSAPMVPKILGNGNSKVIWSCQATDGRSQLSKWASAPLPSDSQDRHPKGE
jgi:hypothetical protein